MKITNSPAGDAVDMALDKSATSRWFLPNSNLRSLFGCYTSACLAPIRSALWQGDASGAKNVPTNGLGGRLEVAASRAGNERFVWSILNMNRSYHP